MGTHSQQELEALTMLEQTRPQCHLLCFQSQPHDAVSLAQDSPRGCKVGAIDTSTIPRSPKTNAPNERFSRTGGFC